MYGNSSEPNWKISGSWTGSIFSEFIGSILYFLKFRKLLWQVDKLWNSMNMELNGVWKVTNREKREHIILEHKKETKFEKLH